MEAEHIFARRTGYTHHGLYIGNGRVIHFSGEPGSKSQAQICETDIGTFSNGDKVFAIKYKKVFQLKNHWKEPGKLLGRAIIIWLEIIASIFQRGVRQENLIANRLIQFGMHLLVIFLLTQSCLLPGCFLQLPLSLWYCFDWLR
ncbi:MAG TPA: lecithin retinol acyltransferase family protein [Pseudomonadales bacterium]